MADGSWLMAGGLARAWPLGRALPPHLYCLNRLGIGCHQAVLYSQAHCFVVLGDHQCRQRNQPRAIAFYNLHYIQKHIAASSFLMFLSSGCRVMQLHENKRSQ